MKESRLRQLEAEAEAAKRLLSKEEPTAAGVVMLADSVLFLVGVVREMERDNESLRRRLETVTRRLPWLRGMGRGR